MLWKPFLPALFLALQACQSMSTSAPPPDLDAVWDYANPAATEERFRALWAEHGAAPLDWRLALRTQIARTYSLRARFPEAHAELDAVEAELERAGPVTRARYLLERGRTYNSAGDRERAAELFRAAFETAEGAGAQRHAADALHMQAIAAPPAQALALNRRAIEYCEACTDPAARRWLGPLYHNTWYAYLELGDFEAALGYAQRSRAYRASIGDAEGERIGRWTIHHTQRRMGAVEEALAGFRALAADYGAAGDPSGYTDEELGECLLILGRTEEARPHFAAAHARLAQDALLAANEPERLERLRALGAPAP
jgi:tetratricopeptide (TPR) repeat protein